MSGRPTIAEGLFGPAVIPALHAEAVELQAGVGIRLHARQHLPRDRRDLVYRIVPADGAHEAHTQGPRRSVWHTYCVWIDPAWRTGSQARPGPRPGVGRFEQRDMRALARDGLVVTGVIVGQT